MTSTTCLVARTPPRDDPRSDLPVGRSPGNQVLQQGLLGVPPVLGLVPDALPVAVQDGLGDLLPRMSGEAVQGERAVAGAVEQRLVEAVGGERLAPGGGLVVG